MAGHGRLTQGSDTHGGICAGLTTQSFPGWVSAMRIHSRIIALRTLSSRLHVAGRSAGVGPPPGCSLPGMRRLRTKTRVADSLAPCEACPAPRPRQRSQPGAPSIKPRRTNKSARAAASCSGLLPKARKGFALFTQARWRDESLPSANADKFRVLGQEWKSLPEEDKRQWHENSKREFEAQRRAALLSGIRVRYDKGAKPMAVEPSPTAQTSNNCVFYCS